ncbi:MAG: M20/M25/M40 family metallo-hydrolase [Tissierellia bacterium]|nr:M20/M25/M40 family metallo-hydrolase [Tissierellia bacterium]
MRKDRLLQYFLDFVQIDSPTGEERDFANHLIPILESLGMQVQIDDTGKRAGSNSGNLIGRLPATSDGPSILFSSHMDTVSPSRGVNPIVRDGIVYSDGTTVLGGDDKAGIAAIIEGIQTVVDENIPHGDIEVVFTICEEGGLFGSKYLDYSKLNSKIGYVFDTGGSVGKIIIGGPSQAQITATFTGREAHAGVSPEEGISAIQMLATAISNMKLLRVDQDTTANIGQIEGGGPTNIVTKQATFFAEARSLDEAKLAEQIHHMREACYASAEEYGGSVEFIDSLAYSAFNVPVESEVVQNVIKALANIGIEGVPTKTGGGSDTSNYNENGISAVNLSIGETKPHTLEESIRIEDLNNSARLVIELIKLYA